MGIPNDEALEILWDIMVYDYWVCDFYQAIVEKPINQLVWCNGIGRFLMAQLNYQ